MLRPFFGILASCSFMGLLTPACAQDDERNVWITPDTLTPGQQATIHYRGRFANRENVSIRYGFNGWNRVEGLNDLQSETDGGNKNFYKESAMMKQPDAEFRLTLDIPASARALHFVFYVQNNGSRRWDHNNRQDYRATVAIPYLGPYLTWNERTHPKDGVVVNYQTASPAPSRVEYGKTPTLGNELTSAVLTESHHLALTGLDEETRYYYRVYGSNGAHSPTYSFTTAKQAPHSFTFIVAGDMQDNGDDRRWNDVAKELMQSDSDSSFLVLVGDMPWNNRPGHWWTFFDNGRDLLASKVVMPAVGNHDTPGNGRNPDTSVFEELFDLPKTAGTESYYAFRFGNAFFLCLNSEIPKQFRKDTGVQFKWARQQLGGDSADRQWVFAYWHVPPYSAAKRHYGEQGRFRDMTSLFDRHVDWVFCGHEHLYQRFKPLRYNANLEGTGRYGNVEGDGVGYLVVPPAGNYPARKLIPFNSPEKRYRDRLTYPLLEDNQNEACSQIGFSKVSISDSNIRIETIGMGTLKHPRDRHVIDSIEYTK